MPSDQRPVLFGGDQRLHDLHHYFRSHRMGRCSTIISDKQRFGLEAAQVVLGHSRAGVTQVYAERDNGLAAKIMSEVG